MKKTVIATLFVVVLWATAAAQPNCNVVVSHITASGLSVSNPTAAVTFCREMSSGSLVVLEGTLCAVTVRPITAPGLSISNPAAATFCMEMNPGSLVTLEGTLCHVTVRRITAPELEVVDPDGGQLFPGGGGGVGNACMEGTEFTLTVPVNPGGNTVQYRWYRDGVLIPGAQGTLTANGTSIAYTIPEDEAFGTGEVVFHFMYTLSDDCDAWTRSDDYPVIFWEPVAFCREMYEGSLHPIPTSRCFVTVHPIAAPAVNVVNPPSLHTFCTAMDPGSLMGVEEHACAVTVHSIAAPAVNVVNPPSLHTFCTAMDPGSLMGTTGHVCAVTVRAISAPGVNVVNPVAARAGIFGFFRGLFN